MEYMPEYIQRISTHMDYDGQFKAERIYQVILVSFGVIGFGIGFFTQQLSHAVYMVLAGFAISCIVTLPPWGYFRRQQLKWQPVGKSATVASGAGGSSKSTTPASNKKSK